MQQEDVGHVRFSQAINYLLAAN